jgi:hypothetical protein
VEPVPGVECGPVPCQAIPMQTTAFSTMAPTVGRPQIRHPGDTMLSLRPGIPRRAAGGLLRLLTQVLLPNPIALSAASLQPMMVILLRIVVLHQQLTHPMLALLLQPSLLRPTMTANLPPLLASSHPPALIATPGLLMRLQNLCRAGQSDCKL